VHGLGHGLRGRENVPRADPRGKAPIELGETHRGALLASPVGTQRCKEPILLGADPRLDCTFSAPKSISVLWALTPDPWVRAEVLAAHEAAVDAALGWFEATGRSPGGAPTVLTRSTPAASLQPCSASTPPAPSTPNSIRFRALEPRRPRRRKHRLTWAFTVERVTRIELAFSAWEASKPKPVTSGFAPKTGLETTLRPCPRSEHQPGENQHLVRLISERIAGRRCHSAAVMNRSKLSGLAVTRK
jgi:hypothetical protein